MQTIAKRGRPKKAEGEHERTPVRQIGRIPDAEWGRLQAAATRSGKTFTAWATEILLRAARRISK